MAKVKLTKNELKRQKDDLARFTRYLPTLELKKKQLLLEINKIQNHFERVVSEIESNDKKVAAWVDVFAEEVDLEPLIGIEDIKISNGNIAGIEIPIFEEVIFHRWKWICCIHRSG
jgi:V/A-type H+-transporting ATPase subunit D